MEYGKDYFGFVYVWYNRTALIMERRDYEDRHNRPVKKHPRLYIGSHMGAYNDGYICSSKWMKAGYKRKPFNFMKRIIYWQLTDNSKELREIEQKWLDLIKEHELGIRFYNMSKKAATPDPKLILKLWADPNHQEKMLQYLNTRWANTEFHAQMCNTMQEVNNRPEKVEASRIASTKRMQDPIEKEKAIAVLHSEEAYAKRWTDENKQKQSELTTKQVYEQWSDDESRQKFVDGAKRRANTEEGKSHHSKNGKKAWEDEDKVAQWKENRKALIKEDKEYHETLKQNAKKGGIARWGECDQEEAKKNFNFILTKMSQKELATRLDVTSAAISRWKRMPISSLNAEKIKDLISELV